MRVRLLAFVAGVLACLVLLPVSVAMADSNVLFIFDASGSMKKKLENGQTRMAIAKQAMGDSLQSMPDDVRVGLLLYGHRRAKDCKDIELVSPIGADDASTIAQTVKGLEAKGETPIADSLKQAARSFAALKGQSNRVILVTDGIEECKGDPCAAAQSLKDTGLDLKVDIVGFTLNDEQRKTIECVAKTTGGQYYDAQDTKGLTAALTSVKEEVVQAAPPRAMLKPTEPILTILTSPNDAWLATVDGKTDSVTWTWKGHEAVYGFTGGRSASFDTFGVAITKSDSGNPKQYEILVGDEGPLGAFRSLGICEISNMALKSAPYQQCKFEPVTAHYVKVKLLNPQDGGNAAFATEFQINATLSPESSATPAPAGSSIAGAANLLNATGIIASPNKNWLATVDGKTDNVAWQWLDEAAVYGFGNGESAEFDTFQVYIGMTESGNPLSYELLVGDEGPVGTFRSIATCEFANTKILKAPFQDCKFAPVTAKYLKVRLVSAQNGGNAAFATEYKLLGKIVPGTATPAAAKPAGIDLLASANGGSLLGTTGKNWEATVDGKTDNVAWLWINEEAVYAFRNEGLATFDTFAVVINKTDSGNPKDYEILAGTDGPTGQFRSVATCSFANVEMIKRPFQECKFGSTTAKYVKVKLLSAQNGGNAAFATEFKLFGTPE